MLNMLNIVPLIRNNGNDIMIAMMIIFAFMLKSSLNPANQIPSSSNFGSFVSSVYKVNENRTCHVTSYVQDNNQVQFEKLD